jgi:hypothetical protein
MKLRFVILLIICASCGTMYIPSARNVPLFENKGEFQSTISYGSGVNLQAAYTPIKHVAFAGNLLYANNHIPDRFTFRRHSAYEGAVGYYTSRKFLFEIITGYGRGFMKGQNVNSGLIIFPTTRDRFEGDYQKLFVQPTFGFRVRTKVQIGLTVRVTHLHFTKIAYSTDDTPHEAPRTDGYFLEPCGTFKIYPVTRSRKFFAFGQAGLNLDMFNIDELFYNPFHINVGVGLRLPGTVLKKE